MVAAPFGNECLLLIIIRRKTFAVEQKIVKTVKVFPLECIAVYGIFTHEINRIFMFMHLYFNK